MGGCYLHPQPPELSAVPFKAKADRRHHIPKQQDRVTNWLEYDAALRQRGSLTVWFTEEAIAAWRLLCRGAMNCDLVRFGARQCYEIEEQSAAPPAYA